MPERQHLYHSFTALANPQTIAFFTTFLLLKPIKKSPGLETENQLQ
jgi:hypothetical protein